MGGYSNDRASRRERNRAERTRILKIRRDTRAEMQRVRDRLIKDGIDPDNPPCSCDEGPHLGAQAAGTPPHCERCGGLVPVE